MNHIVMGVLILLCAVIVPSILHASFHQFKKWYRIRRYGPNYQFGFPAQMPAGARHCSNRLTLAEQNEMFPAKPLDIAVEELLEMIKLKNNQQNTVDLASLTTSKTATIDEIPQKSTMMVTETASDGSYIAYSLEMSQKKPTCEHIEDVALTDHRRSSDITEQGAEIYKSIEATLDRANSMELVPAYSELKEDLEEMKQSFYKKDCVICQGCISEVTSGGDSSDHTSGGDSQRDLERQQEDSTPTCPKDILVRILPCSHMFHDQCISLWLSRKAVCPICNKQFQPIGREEQPQMREHGQDQDQDQDQDQEQVPQHQEDPANMV